MEVYFDDFKVTQTKSPVIQSEDYYPFGLTFNSYTRENSLINKFKFQSQEHIDDLGLNWDSFKWRNHQPDIGRFFNVDPLADKYVYNSPYAFSENQVVAHRELEGLEKYDIKKDIIPPTNTGTENYTPGNNGPYTKVATTETTKTTTVTDNTGSTLSNTVENRPYDLKGGSNLPTSITTTGKDGKEITVSVSFGGGFKSDNFHTPNNKVSSSAMDGYVQGIKNANKAGAGITSVMVTATTNGHHGDSGGANWDKSDSQHYVRSGAKAIDTGLINGQSPGSFSDSTVIKFQSGMNMVPTINENFGPSYKSKPVSGHDTWVHTSFNN
jgi:RHS repeat-associated protein